VTRTTFHVHVDPGKCQGHNRCYSVSPELSELDDLGTSSTVGAGLLAAALVGTARLAVANRSEHAISLTEAGDGEATDGQP
jgi:ferredoxin